MDQIGKNLALEVLFECDDWPGLDLAGAAEP
jgi:hypothetical protein